RPRARVRRHRLRAHDRAQRHPNHRLRAARRGAFGRGRVRARGDWALRWVVMRRLIVMDVDSTFIAQEQIDLLAALAGTGEQVAEITERAMRGELDFEASLRARVATLAGLADTAFEEVRGQVSFTPGALELLEHCAERGWPVALVSG